MRTVLLFVCLITVANLSAQQKTKRILTGVKVGTEVGLIGLDQKPISSNTEIGLGYSIIVDFVEYKINDKFSANLGVGFTNRKYRQYIDNIPFLDIFAQASGKEHLLIQNIEIPLTGKYYLDSKKKHQFYLICGGSLNYNLHNSSQQELLFSDGTVWEYNHQNDLKRTTFSAILGTGFQYETSIHSNFGMTYILEPIVQINPNNIDFLYGRDAKLLVSVGLRAGVKF